MRGPITGRMAHLRESLFRPLWSWIPAGLLAFVVSGVWLRNALSLTSARAGSGTHQAWALSPWLVLLALAILLCLFEGTYRRYRSLQAKLDGISRERPLAIVDCDFAVDIRSIRQRQVLSITGWSLKLKNRSLKLLKLEVEDAYLKAGGGIASQIPAVSKYIYASPYIEMVHRLMLAEPFDVGPVPAIFEVGFTISYDNVPAIGRRTLVRKIRYEVSALLPLTSSSEIVHREEL